MNLQDMREALLKYYATEGMDRSVDWVNSLSETEVANHYERLLDEITFEKARNKLDEDTTQKAFDLDKGRGKIS